MTAQTAVRAQRRVWLGALVAVLLAPLLAACTSSGAATPIAVDAPGATSTLQRGTVSIPDGKRPFTLHVPQSYDPTRAAPLVILLHGYTATGAGQEAYMKFIPQSDKRGFLYAYPDGLIDPMNNHYWNATDACCDLYHSNVDDSAYLSDLIKTVETTYNVDAKRVYLVGHSNGAFMTFRMACDHADQITAIAALNGAMWSDLSKCKPSKPVSVLDIRSTADQTIRYAGGDIVNNAYPSAATSDADWVRFDKCSAKSTAAPSLDIVQDLPTTETSVARFTTGCAGGSTVETWAIKNGMHIPNFGPTFASDVMDFLLSQVKQ